MQVLADRLPVLGHLAHDELRRLEWRFDGREAAADDGDIGGGPFPAPAIVDSGWRRCKGWWRCQHDPGFMYCFAGLGPSGMA